MRSEMKYPKIFFDGIDYSDDPESAKVLLNHMRKVWKLSLEPEPVADHPKKQRHLQAIKEKV